MSANHLRQLRSGAEQLGVELTAQQADQLVAYLGLLHKWNKAYNLTAVRDPDEMVSRHLLDSLSVLAYVQGQRCLDVGSGGGMPGVVLAIMAPQRSLTVLDSNGKKTRFLTQVRFELGLENLTVVNSRVEAHAPEQGYDVIISRAFSSLADFTQITRHLGSERTRWLAMKGLYPEEELDALPVDFQVTESAQLSVPGCQGTRHLLILRRVTAADNG